MSKVSGPIPSKRQSNALKSGRRPGLAWTRPIMSNLWNPHHSLSRPGIPGIPGLGRKFFILIFFTSVGRCRAPVSNFTFFINLEDLEDLD
jgi:hypothetical protein